MLLYNWNIIHPFICQKNREEQYFLNNTEKIPSRKVCFLSATIFVHFSVISGIAVFYISKAIYDLHLIFIVSVML